MEFHIIAIRLDSNIDLILDIKKIIITEKEYEEELEDILNFKELFKHIEIVVVPK